MFQRRDDAAAEGQAAAAPDAVAAARARARRRLIGATVLLAAGVIGFPLLFETQPRPIPVDIPIEVPRRDSAGPLAPPDRGLLPGVPAEAPGDLPGDAPASAPPPRADLSAPRPPEIVERADEPAAPVARAAAASRPAAPASRPAPAASRPADDGARAKALLDGGPAASAPAVRVVVQVGAYAEPDKLREARQKVERLGFKTYTQVVQVDGTSRTRVRVGPFATRAEADRAAERIKASGLPVAILTL